jgi:hypothetical protein
VSIACLQHHQLTTVLNVSLSTIQMIFEITWINRMGQDDFGDETPMYIVNVTKMAVMLRSEKNCF